MKAIENKSGRCGVAEMYIIVGHTRGDDLFPSEAKPLFASPERAVCEAKMAEIQKERDEWLSQNEVPHFAQCSIFSRFEVVKTPY